MLDSTSPANARHDEQNLPWRPSHEIFVGHYEATLVWPIHLQPERWEKSRGERHCQNPSLDPQQPGFLDRWVDFICSNSNWAEQDNRAYPSGKLEYPERAYSEFCYFNPFVRNFLYVTRDDIRQAQGGDVRNRNLRIIKRTDLQDANAKLKVLYNMDDIPDNYRDIESTFQIQSCWLYLFDTQIALAELRFHHESSVPYQGESVETDFNPESLKLNLRMTLKLQDIIRRVYSPYWSVFEPPWDPGKRKIDDPHVPLRLSLVIPNQPAVHSYFGGLSTEKYTSAEIQSWKGGPLFERLDEADQQRLRCGQVKHLSPQGVEVLQETAFDRLEPENWPAAWAYLQHQRHVFEHREPYAVEVWQELLKPISPTQLSLTSISSKQSSSGEQHSGGPLRFEQVQDDRVPILSYISIEDPQTDSPESENQPRAIRQISTGDWLRLANIDDQGDSATYPYSPSFFGDDKNPLIDFSYDRFWHATGKPPAQDQSHATRWLCSSYSFVGVGEASNRAFFTDEHAGALCHFRHHYFALALIALFHRASLMNYKHRLAETSDALLVKDSHPDVVEYHFRQDIEQLAKELMKFRTLYWFAEVSNQIQGMELFDLFRKHLNLEHLFNAVSGDIENATALLRQWDADGQARAGTNLAVVGAILTAIAPMLIWFDHQLGESGIFGSDGWTQAFSTGFALLTLTSLLLLFVRPPVHWPWMHEWFLPLWFRLAKDRKARRTYRNLALGGLGFVGALGLILTSIFTPGTAQEGKSLEPPAENLVAPSAENKPVPQPQGEQKSESR